MSSSAAREVTSKSEAQLEAETAKKWAARALACYARYVKTRESDWLLRAESYRHEAIEHGALVGDGGKTVAALERQLRAFRPKRRKARNR